MQEKDEEQRDYFRRIDPLRADNAEDIELAYRLQNTTRMDHDLLRRIIDGYADELYRWIRVLLYYQNRAEPTREAICAVLQSVLMKAGNHLDQFQGQSSVPTWLFAITYQMVKVPALTGWLNLDLTKSLYQKSSKAPLVPIGWQGLEILPERQRAPLLLRYLFDMELSDIAIILGWQRREVHHQLIKGIERLLTSSSPPGIDVHVLAYLDGFWGDDPDALSQFEQHLQTCDVCRSSIEKISGVEKSLAENLRKRWEVKTLTLEELGAIEQAILVKILPRDEHWKPRINLHQVIWSVGLSVLLVGLAVLSIRLTPSEREFLSAQATPTPQLPPIINMQPLMSSGQDSSMGINPPQFIIPAVSSDATWAVFSVIKAAPVTVSNVQLTVQLYNRKTNTTQVVSTVTGWIQLPWAYWVLAPSISADGTRMVYVTSSNDPKLASTPCTTPGKQACLDIFVFDRATGLNRRLTQSWNAGAANGSSLSPTISANGRWVAFWSQADNLIEGDHTVCQQDKMGSTCLFIYLYDLQTDRIVRLPDLEIKSDIVPGVDRISLSNDGRYVGFTLVTTALVDKILPGNLPDAEAVIYDQQTSKFELENRAQDGTPGNGPSNSPVLSSDGRYVAFSSSASNLVIGDSNHNSDVFVRDRTNGAVELISVSSNGIQGNDNSGLTYWKNSVYSLNLSSDGRYVVFESAATNLAQGTYSECSGGGINICNLLYLRDRETGHTTLIVALPNQDYSFFPGISTDGRWLAFMQPNYDCVPDQALCSNVMMYDQQMDEMLNLTGYGGKTSRLSWINSVTQVLPLPASENTALAFSPEGKLLALVGHYSTVRVWQISKDIHSIIQENPDITLDNNTNDAFTCVAISQDSRWLAAGTTDGKVYIWDLPSKKLLYTLQDQVAPIRKIVFSQDGSHLIIGMVDKIQVWTLGSGKIVSENTIGFSQTAIYALDISPKGDLVATARGDGTIWLQDLLSGKIVARLGGQHISVSTLAFSPDGSLLAARSSEGIINVWSLTPSITLLSSIHTYYYVGSLVFSPDNKYLASTGLIGEVTVWSIPDGTSYTLSTSPPNGMVFAVSFSPQGNILAAVFENEIVLWGIPSGKTSTYFIRTDADSPVTTQTLSLSTAMDIPEYSSDVGSVQHLNLDQAWWLVKYPLIVPSQLPASIYYVDSTVNRDGSVWLHYEDYGNQAYSAHLYIYEKQIEEQESPTMTVGATADITRLRFETYSGPVDAEYVHGDWFSETMILSPSEDSLYGEVRVVFYWDDSAHSQRLRWQQDGVLIAIYYRVNQYYQPVLDEPLLNQTLLSLNSVPTKSDIEQIASGMVLYTQLQAP